VLLGAVVFSCLPEDPEEIDYRAYQKIQKGATLQEVRAVFGPGKRLDVKAVPVGRFETKSGTRIKPLVEGDLLYVWDRNRHKIYIGFDEDGKLVSKFFWSINCL
jgi:hypothetical protein